MKRMLIVGVAVAFALFTSLAPFVAAHVDSYTQSRALQAGPYLVFFEPRPTPPFANNTVSMVAQISDSGTGATLTRIPASILVGGPDHTERKKMESDGTGYLVASMFLPSPGNYSARVFVTDPKTNETFAAETEFEVFPDIAYRILPFDQSVDAFEGKRSTLAYQVLDHITLEPAALTDLTVRMEHWSEDHTLFLSADETEAKAAGYGTWKIEYTFPDKGMYHMRFASLAGGFNYPDVPLLHVYATAAEEAPSANTPFFTLGALLAAVGLITILRKR